MKLEDTELTKVDFEDDRFRISYFFNLERLKHSISEFGLLSPLVLAHRDGRSVIVMGWKRALACRELSLLSIPCLILEEPDDLKAFILAILENASMRDFSLLELAAILKKLMAFGMAEKNILGTYLPLFGIPQTLAHLDVYMALAELDDETKEFIHTKHALYPVVQQLIALNREERAVLLPHLWHLGQNKQKELLEFLCEISKRDDISVREVLASEAISSVIRSTRLSPPQKADRIRMLLRERRYPAHSAQEEAFESSLRKMGWPEDISIAHSPFFEGEDLSVRFAFKDSAEFKDKVQLLQKLASSTRIEDLLKSMSNE
ncbi:ParB/RepB/Spo0J family partition protein [Acidobacteriota bacterium]